MIDKHEEKVVPGTVHYISHKEVLKDDRGTTNYKLRVVYDASAKSYSEPSLNDCLLSGPALTPLLFDILLRFRLPKIALIGDLEKAFLNVEVKPEDRNLLRFLWIDDVNSLNPEIIKLRFTRLVFGLVSSPFILNVTLRNHLSKYENIDPEFVSTVIKALYVDDFASGRNTVLDCFELYQKLKTRFREGGFNMRKWASNSRELNELIKKEETTLLSGKPAVEPTKSVETENIEVDVVINWTDSQIVWWWINGKSKQFKQFVQNRVENTSSLWNKEHWRYYPSELNPSDIASRGSKASDLVSSDLWWKGAPLLEKEERQWPNVPNCPITEEKVTSEAEKELKVGDASKTSSFMTASSKVS